MFSFDPCEVEIINLKAATCGAYKPYPTVHQTNKLPQVEETMVTLENSFSSSRSSDFLIVNAVR